MSVRFEFMVEIAHLLLQLLDFPFECFDALFNFGMLVTMWLDGHEPSFKSDEILASRRLNFKSVVRGSW